MEYINILWIALIGFVVFRTVNQYERKIQKITAILERHEKKIRQLEAQLGTQSKKTPGTLGRPSQRRDSSDSG